MRRLTRQLDDPSRRRLVAGAAAAFLGVGLDGSVYGFDGGAAPAGRLIRKPTAKKVIYLFMNGGMSHLDTFDLKPGADVQGPVEAIKTAADGVRISQYLPQLAAHMKDVAVINSMTSNQGAHEQGQYFMRTSYVQRGTIKHPAMGAWMAHLHGRINDRLPSNVLIGNNSRHPGSGYLGATCAPLPIGNAKSGLQHSALPRGVTQERMNKRLALAEEFHAAFRNKYKHKAVGAYHDLYDEALGLMQSTDLQAFDIRSEPAELRAAYGENSFGLGCLLARRLVEHDVRFVEVSLGGWDTHNDNHDRVEQQAATLDAALSTLLGDLRRRGLLEETLVVLATEFGRKPIMNGNDGRDHHPAAFSCLLAGGGVRGGQIYGKTDPTGHGVIDGRVEVQDFNASIAYALGLPYEQTVLSPNGRPFKVADKGQPISALF